MCIVDHPLYQYIDVASLKRITYAISAVEIGFLLHSIRNHRLANNFYMKNSWPLRLLLNTGTNSPICKRGQQSISLNVAGRDLATFCYWGRSKELTSQLRWCRELISRQELRNVQSVRAVHIRALWYPNLPISAYLIQRKHISNCGMSKLSLIYPRSNPELHILRLSSKLAYIYLQKTKHHKLLAPISRNQTTSSVHSEDMIYNHRSIYRKSFILIIVIQKYLTITSPHVPNGKPRDRVGVGGGGLHPRV